MKKAPGKAKATMSRTIAKQHMLEIVGVATLGDLLKLELLEDGVLKSKLTNDRVTLTVANVKAWIVALKAKRAE